MSDITRSPYPPETLDSDEDDGTMPENLASLADQVVGHRIIRAEMAEYPGRYYGTAQGLVLTLSNGKRVRLADTDDCCAFTSLDKFLAHPENVDHVITGVGTTDGYTRWHIYADLGDVIELDVSWSCGNPFYYGYGFDISVEDLPEIEARVIPQKQIGEMK